MKHIYRLFCLALTALLISGCASIQVADYAQEKPKFDLREYFNGRIIAHGIVQDRSGKVIRRMTVELGLVLCVICDLNRGATGHQQRRECKEE